MLKEKILVVEDNPQNMRLFEMILSDRGYALLKAVDGEGALDMAIPRRKSGGNSASPSVPSRPPSLKSPRWPQRSRLHG